VDDQLQTGGSAPNPAKGRVLSLTRPKIVAVDGPAGSGKSSICHQVAARIGWTYINTGALYRAIGLLALTANMDLDDEAGIAAMIDEIAPDLRWDSPRRELWYREQNLTPRLDSEEAGYAASKVARQRLVRERLLPVQRQLTLSAPYGALVDGRDIGTVVFPEANLKIFLTASLEERSRRRLAQLGQATDTSSEQLDNVRRGLARRDERDAHRGVAPLKQAADAVVLDTSELSFDKTVEAMIALIRERGLVL